MDSQEADFYAQLLDTFKIEADEHLKNISENLLNLEGTTDDQLYLPIIEVVFREAHSLKGAARAVNLTDIQELCQTFEDVMAQLKQKKLALSKKLFQVLYQTIDALGHFIQTCKDKDQQVDRGLLQFTAEELQNLLENKGEFPSISREKPAMKEAASALPLQVEKTVPPSEKNVSPPPKTTHPCDAEASQAKTASAISPKADKAKTIRIAVPKLDQLLQKSEEMLAVKLNSGQLLKELNTIQTYLKNGLQEIEAHKEDMSVLKALCMESAAAGNKSADSLLVKSKKFLLWENDFLTGLEKKISQLIKEASQDVRLYGTIIEALLDDVKKVLMQPFSTLTEAFPRMVRDISLSLEKEVRLEMQGGDIEIDRRILEELKDPLTHLIRNCIDHGIESVQERSERKKNAAGCIIISAAQASGNFVEIQVKDDGRGIDYEKVKHSAVKLGMISQSEASQLKPEEAQMLIFRSGITTSPIITDLSGRGLGLGIVAEKVEKLGGQVSLETKPNKGTTFTLRIPLTMATFRGLQVRVGTSYFILPTLNVKRVARIGLEEIHSLEDREAVYMDSQMIPLVRLNEVLEMEGVQADLPESTSLVLVLLSALNITIALKVDEIINEQEVFVKGLGEQLVRVRNVAAATITECGMVIPILDPFDLVKSAVRSPGGQSKAIPNEPIKKTSKKVILVVEDSMTARVLLKNILESSGYDVKTAVDGIEGLTLLRVEPIDLVVSDIEMPRMDGFELTEKIRTAKDLQALPVILCTSRGSKEDREHGIAVGANAYIDKNNFAQSNLLDLIQKLL